MPAADPSEHTLQNQIDRFRQTLTNMNIDSVILVTHDWGTILGYMFAYLHADIVTKLVVTDIGNDLSDFVREWNQAPLTQEYQLTNIQAYEQQDNSIINDYTEH